VSVSEESPEQANVRFTEREALFYHNTIRPGKIEIIASKPMATQRDLSLAYSPGVAVPVEAIAKDPAGHLERHGHSGSGQSGRSGVKAGDGGQGGPLQALCRRRSIDIELNSEDPEALIEAIALMEPSFGGSTLKTSRPPNVS
jgi:malate dehydrogenase (oxaloacetate-decarboxylating)(NADP+)